MHCSVTSDGSDGTSYQDFIVLNCTLLIIQDTVMHAKNFFMGATSRATTVPVGHHIIYVVSRAILELILQLVREPVIGSV